MTWFSAGAFRKVDIGERVATVYGGREQPRDRPPKRISGMSAHACERTTASWTLDVASGSKVRTRCIRKRPSRTIK